MKPFARPWTGLLLAGLLLAAGCLGDRTRPSQPSAPDTSKVSKTLEVSGAASGAGGWTGAILPLCSMAQFSHYFQRADGEKYGIQGATAEVQAVIDKALCQERATVRVWGPLEAETIDVNGRRIVAERVVIVETYPPLVPEKGPGEERVEGWQGRIRPTCRQAGADDLFERDDGMRFGVAAEDDAVREALDIAECEGYPVRLWGTLKKGVADYRGTQIVVERIEK